MFQTYNGTILKRLRHNLASIIRWLKGTQQPGLYSLAERDPRAARSSALGASVLMLHKHSHTAPRGPVNSSPRFHQSKMCAPASVVREREAALTDGLLSVLDGATDEQPRETTSLSGLQSACVLWGPTLDAAGWGSQM